MGHDADVGFDASLGKVDEWKRIQVSTIPSHEDRNTYSFRNVVFFIMLYNNQ
jgi:hypothetical protein